ncbi:hypothetical protein AAZX31_08G066900 [Glycine max]|uniref:Uncharacterized protein n=1 Tax=Glycine max TaxID=3847 RepID=K7L5B6_SOYBN|nr:hypothetical protein JHK87_020566 [Glycine soja]KAG5014976.1 hypothetical protein JHK85_021112 [Glycine max]KAG5024763.1 hypothetical protein JHK86_020677 [Glycine max]KAG5135934.1 hypothetical protein JHK82_020665 [Glycine max]KAH1050010.1 hypothetical protein GYH30_020477 [Glycine max]
MASHSFIILALFISISFSSMDMTLAARHLQQTTRSSLQLFPFLPNITLPIPRLPNITLTNVTLPIPNITPPNITFPILNVTLPIPRLSNITLPIPNIH